MFDKIRNQFPNGSLLSAHITGGGVSFFDKLLSPGGASRFFCKGVIPYSVGSGPQALCPNAVSMQVAMLLASDAYWDCSEQKDNCNLLSNVGVGATFSLIKDGEREGRTNHGYICIHLGKPAYNYYVIFDKTVLDTRAKQEGAAADIIAQIIVYHTVDCSHKIRYEGAIIEY